MIAQALLGMTRSNELLAIVAGAFKNQGGYTGWLVAKRLYPWCLSQQLANAQDHQVASEPAFRFGDVLQAALLGKGSRGI